MQAQGRVGSVIVVQGLQRAWALSFAARGLCSLLHVGSLVEARELSSCVTRA